MERGGLLRQFLKIFGGLGESVGGVEEVGACRVEVAAPYSHHPSGVLGLGRVAGTVEQQGGAVVVGGGNCRDGGVKVGHGRVGVMLEGDAYHAVELGGAFGVEARHSEHLVERHHLWVGVDDAGELLVGHRLKTCGYCKLGGAQAREPFGENHVAVESGKARVGLERALLGVVVGRAVGGGVDELEEVGALSVGQLGRGYNHLAELAPVFGHGAVGALLGGEAEALADVLGQCARAVGGEVVVVAVWRLGRCVSAYVDACYLDVGVGGGVAYGVVDDGELLAVVDALSVAALVGLGVKLCAVDLKLHACFPFVDGDGQLGDFGGEVGVAHHGCEPEGYLHNLASGGYSASACVVDDAEECLWTVHPAAHGSSLGVGVLLGASVVAPYLGRQIVGVDNLAAERAALVGVVHVASVDEHGWEGYPLGGVGCASVDYRSDVDLMVGAEVERVEHKLHGHAHVGAGAVEVDVACNACRRCRGGCGRKDCGGHHDMYRV